MKLILVALAVALLISLAVADVQISHTYYTNGDETNEDVYLHNTDYTNEVSIDAGHAIATASGIPRDATDYSRFTDSIWGNGVGASLSIDAKDFTYSKTLGIGSSKWAGFSYGFGSGEMKSSYYNDNTDVIEKIISDNNLYSASFLAGPELSQSNGIGMVAGAGPSSFSYTISMNQNGKSCTMESKLATKEDGSGDDHITWNLPITIPEDSLAKLPEYILDRLPKNIPIKLPIIPGQSPVYYDWNTFGGNDQDYAEIGINIHVQDGNLPVDASIVGGSNVLSGSQQSKLNLDRATGWFSVSQDIYMKYEIAS